MHPRHPARRSAARTVRARKRSTPTAKSLGMRPRARGDWGWSRMARRRRSRSERALGAQGWIMYILVDFGGSAIAMGRLVTLAYAYYTFAAPFKVPGWSPG